MRIPTVFAVSTLLLISIGDQAQAVNLQSPNLLELTAPNYMMSAQVGQNRSSQPHRGNGRRFAEIQSSINQDDNCTAAGICPRRGSGR